MIGLLSLLFGVALLLLLLLVAIKGMLTARELETGGDLPIEDERGVYPLPLELADRIFSRTDWQFVSKKKSNCLQELFVRERKALALLWVRQTFANIRQVMREHAQAARSSRNLKPATELRLFVQYGILAAACGLLFAAIQVAGPYSVPGLAFYAQGLSHRISGARQKLAAATQPTGIRMANP